MLIAKTENREDLGVLPEQNPVAIDKVVGPARSNQAPRSVLSRHLQIRVAQESKWDLALRGKLPVFLHRVGADPKDRNVAGPELIVVIAEGADLRRADRSEVPRIEENQHWLSVAVVAEAHNLTIVGRELKRGGGLVHDQKVRQPYSPLSGFSGPSVRARNDSCHFTQHFGFQFAKPSPNHCPPPRSEIIIETNAPHRWFVPESPAHDELRSVLLELYAAILGSTAPTDQFIGGFLRQRPMVRGGARTFLAAAVYSLLRFRVRTVHLAIYADNPNPPPPADGIVPPAFLPPAEEAAFALYRWLREDLDASVDKAFALTVEAGRLLTGRAGTPMPADRLMDFAQRFELDRELRHAPALARDAASCSLPPEILARWIDRFGREAALNLARSFALSAPLDLRVNRHRVSRDEALARLHSEGIDATPGIYSSDCVQIVRKGPLKKSAAWQAGLFEVQEQASQLVSLAVDPQPGWRILDACAGGGGKAMHLASLAGEGSTVYTHDIEPSRMEPIAKRAAASGLANIRVIDGAGLQREAPFDAVLIDAPCLGLGRLRRDPTVAWRGNLADRIREVTEQQRACLHAYAPLVKPGGVLVYATCSFEPEETTILLQERDQVAPDLHPDPLPASFDHPDLVPWHGCESSQVTLLPSAHGTDGFFIARFRKHSGK